MNMFERKIVEEILQLGAISPARLQILIGPRQVGKSAKRQRPSKRPRNIAVEVKSRRPGKTSGLSAFKKKHPKSTPLIIGSDGIPLEEIF